MQCARRGLPWRRSPPLPRVLTTRGRPATMPSTISPVRKQQFLEEQTHFRGDSLRVGPLASPGSVPFCATVERALTTFDRRNTTVYHGVQRTVSTPEPFPPRRGRGSAGVRLTLPASPSGIFRSRGL